MKALLAVRLWVWISVLGLSPLTLANPARAQGHSALDVLLGAIDVPLTPATLVFHRVSVEDLTKRIDDEDAPIYRRARAVAALGMLQSEAALLLLETIARAPARTAMRRQALISMSRVFGETDRHRVTAVLIESLAYEPGAKWLHRELARLRDSR